MIEKHLKLKKQMTDLQKQLNEVVVEIDRLYTLPVSRKTIGKIIDLKKRKEKLWNKMHGLITINPYFEK